MKHRINVAMVEDNKRLRLSLEALVNVTPDLRCVRTCGSGEEAVECLPAVKPDVVLMDIRLPGMSGIECVSVLRDALPQARFLMLTAYEEDSDVFQSILAGAHGYVLKSMDPERLVVAIRDAHAGETPMAGSVARRLMEHFRAASSGSETMASLSSRELEVLELLAQECMYKEIADRLGVSFATVRTHVEHIYQKLHVRSRSQAVSRFRELKIGR
jgi:DNA-binding NarL/FixJ family response regulator